MNITLKKWEKINLKLTKMASITVDTHDIKYWTSLIPIYTKNVKIAEKQVKDALDVWNLMRKVDLESASACEVFYREEDFKLSIHISRLSEAYMYAGMESDSFNPEHYFNEKEGYLCEWRSKVSPLGVLGTDI